MGNICCYEKLLYIELCWKGENAHSNEIKLEQNYYFSNTGRQKICLFDLIFTDITVFFAPKKKKLDENLMDPLYSNTILQELLEFISLKNRKPWCKR